MKHNSKFTHSCIKDILPTASQGFPTNKLLLSCSTFNLLPLGRAFRPTPQELGLIRLCNLDVFQLTCEVGVSPAHSQRRSCRPPHNTISKYFLFIFECLNCYQSVNSSQGVKMRFWSPNSCLNFLCPPTGLKFLENTWSTEKLNP